MPSSTVKWNFRTASYDDWDQISQIVGKIATEEGFGGYINDVGRPYLDIGKTYIIGGSEIVGFQNVRDAPDGSIYLSGLRVSKSFRKQGVATRLINHVLKEAKKSGKHTARTYIEPSNNASLSLMKKLGFSISGKMNFFFGSVDLTGFEKGSEWPDSLVDIGHLPSFPCRGIPADLLMKGDSLISICNSNVWDKEPTYTVLSGGNFNFTIGNSFITVPSSIKMNQLDILTKIRGFESAYVLERPLKKAGNLG